MKDILIYTVNSGVTVQEGSNVPVGAVVRRKGCGMSVVGDMIKTSAKGFYELTVSATFNASAAGAVTVSATYNGAAIPGATATETITTANTEQRSVSFSAIVCVNCPCDGGISITIDGVGSVTFENIAVEVVSV